MGVAITRQTIARTRAAGKSTCPPGGAPAVLNVLRPSCRRVWNALCSLRDGQTVTAGLRTIARAAGLSPTGAAFALARLQEANLLARQVRGPGRGRASVIVLNWVFPLYVHPHTPKVESLRKAAFQDARVSDGTATRLGDVVRSQRRLALQAGDGALAWAAAHLRRSLESPAELRADLLTAALVALRRAQLDGVCLAAWNASVRRLAVRLSAPPPRLRDSCNGTAKGQVWSWVGHVVREVVQDERRAAGLEQAALAVQAAQLRAKYEARDAVALPSFAVLFRQARQGKSRLTPLPPSL